MPCEQNLTRCLAISPQYLQIEDLLTNKQDKFLDKHSNPEPNPFTMDPQENRASSRSPSETSAANAILENNMQPQGILTRILLSLISIWSTITANFGESSQSLQLKRELEQWQIKYNVEMEGWQQAKTDLQLKSQYLNEYDLKLRDSNREVDHLKWNIKSYQADSQKQRQRIDELQVEKKTISTEIYCLQTKIQHMGKEHNATLDQSRLMTYEFRQAESDASNDMKRLEADKRKLLEQLEQTNRTLISYEEKLKIYSSFCTASSNDRPKSTFEMDGANPESFGNTWSLIYNTLHNTVSRMVELKRFDSKIINGKFCNLANLHPNEIQLSTRDQIVLIEHHITEELANLWDIVIVDDVGNQGVTICLPRKAQAIFKKLTQLDNFLSWIEIATNKESKIHAAITWIKLGVAKFLLNKLETPEAVYDKFEQENFNPFEVLDPNLGKPLLRIYNARFTAIQQMLRLLCKNTKHCVMDGFQPEIRMLVYASIYARLQIDVLGEGKITTFAARPARYRNDPIPNQAEDIVNQEPGVSLDTTIDGSLEIPSASQSSQNLHFTLFNETIHSAVSDAQLLRSPSTTKRILFTVFPGVAYSSAFDKSGDRKVIERCRVHIC